MDALPLHGNRLSGEDFVVVEWRAAPDTSAERPVAGLHVHHEDDEAWYVLRGRIGFRLGHEEVEAGPGSAVLARRGTPHAYWNAGRERAEYLLVMPPRIASLIDAVHEPGADAPAVFKAHASELLG